MKPALCVVVHEVAPATMASCDAVLRAVREVADVPVTLLAVPRYHCEPATSAFSDWVGERVLAGDELALQGYTHQDDGTPRGLVEHMRRRHQARGQGEFWDLSMTEAMRRMTAGIRWFARHGLMPRGFVAPAWQMSLGTWEALRWMDMSYTCTARHLVLLPEKRFLSSPALVYGSGRGWLDHAGIAWNGALAAMLRGNPLLRLELHPEDAQRPPVRRAWQRLLASHIAGRRACTLAEVAQGFRQETDWDSLVSGLHFWDEDDAPRSREPRRASRRQGSAGGLAAGAD